VKRTATSWIWVFDDALVPDRPLVRRDELQEGDLDDPTDDRLTRTEFASAVAAAADGAAGESPWILEQPWHALVLGADGQAVSESWTGMDGMPPGAAPTRGLTTRIERRGGPPGPAGLHGSGDPQNPVVSRTFDARAELATETDPLGRTRRIDRGLSDPSLTFPERETNALGQVSERRFDARTGLLLRSTDPNGRAVEFEYDGFGRRLAECNCSIRRATDGRHRTKTPGADASDASPGGQRRRGAPAATVSRIGAYFDGLGRGPRDYQRIATGRASSRGR
jgi:YD repeat-containing protein